MKLNKIAVHIVEDTAFQLIIVIYLLLGTYGIFANV